jgi:hypothetical protein
MTYPQNYTFLGSHRPQASSTIYHPIFHYISYHLKIFGKRPIKTIETYGSFISTSTEKSSHHQLSHDPMRHTAAHCGAQKGTAEAAQVVEGSASEAPQLGTEANSDLRHAHHVGHG